MVFPDLPAADIPGASQASLAQWDSLAQVTLLSTISEEFHIELDDDVFEELNSYLLIVNFVENQVGEA